MKKHIRIALSTLLLGVAMSIFSFGHAKEPESLTIRPLHYVSTDKPIYRPGETVYLRDVILDAETNFPIDTKGHDYEVVWKILGPKGDEVYSTMTSPAESVASLTWTVENGLPGGIYTARVENVGDGAPAERKFEVKAFRVPRIKSQIEFRRRGYLPGEEVTAVVKFERAEGGLPENPVVEANALVDGETVFAGKVSAKNGQAQVKFTLPEKLAEGDGTLAFIIQDGGVIETAAKTIPILVDNYTVDFYPEGGDLVAGVPNRIYVEGLQRNGKGADFAGKVVDADGNEVADFATRFDGRGIIELTPAEGASYKLVVTNAATGQVRSFALPEAKKGALVRATQDVYAFKDEITVEVKATEGADIWPVKVRLRKRDKDLATAEAKEPGVVKLEAGESEGVLIATLFAHNGRPLAERLLFRAPRFRILTLMRGLNESYAPGEKVKLSFTTVDEQGNPVSANVGFTVTDASVLEMIDRREQAPHLPEMVYLENEVRNFADAADYFNPKDPDANTKIDLLLGTQGWRRFAEVKFQAGEGEEEFKDALKRAMGLPALTLRPPVIYKAAGGGRRGFFGFGAPVDDAMAMQVVYEDGAEVVEVEREVLRAEVNGVAEPMPVPMAPAKGADDVDEFVGGGLVLVIAEKFHFGADANLIIKGLDLIASHGLPRKARLVLVRAALWGESDDTRGFGHTVGFRDIIATASLVQEVVDAFLVGRVQHVARNIDGFQIREIVFVVLFLREDVPIRGNREDMLRLVLDDGFQESLFVDERDDSGAHPVAEREGEGVGSIERKDGQTTKGGVVARNIVEDWRFREGGVQDVLGGQHDAFHDAGGAAGLEQGSHLVGLPMVWFAFVFAVRRLEEVLPMAELLVFQKHLFSSVEPLAYAVPKGDPGNGIGTRTNHHFFNIDFDLGSSPAFAAEAHNKQHFRLCPVNDFTHLRRCVSDINHARDRTDFVQRIETHHRFGKGGQ